VGRVLPSPFCYHSAVGYSLAAQFQTESSADRAYRQVTRDLSRMRAELSAFQFEDAPYWYVAVVGDSEDIGVFKRLARHLVTGRIIPLPEATHDKLLAHRVQSEST
jgi:hypothetical protein